MKIAIEDLRSKMLATLADRFPPFESARIVEALLWADMAGARTQGVIKFTGTTPMQDISPEHETRIERETAVSALMNGGANPAPLVAQEATDLVIEKTIVSGMGIVGVRNIWSSTGAQAFYARRIADAGFIGIVQSRPPSATAAFGSLEPVFGTNPIAFSFPTLDAPLVFDMTTSAMTWYGLILAEAQGAEIPVGVAVDSNGDPTTNPTEAMGGALLPFGGSYKGAGMALVVEVLAGVLPGAAYSSSEGEWGSSFLAIDPEVLVGRDEFRRRCSDLVQKVKGAKKLPGVTSIRLPGERSNQSLEEARRTGMVEVDYAILHRLGYV